MLKLPCGPPWTTKAIGSLAAAAYCGPAGFSLKPHTLSLLAPVKLNFSKLTGSSSASRSRLTLVSCATLPLAVDAIQVVRRLDAVHREQDRAVGQRHGGMGRALGGQPGHPAARDIDAEQRGFQRVLRIDDDRLAVLRPGDRADRTVPIGGDGTDLAGGEIADLEHLAVGLVAGARHREIGEAAAVGRQRRQIVGSVIVGRQVGRLGRSVSGRREDVEIGRGRLDAPGLAKGEIDGAPVSRDIDLLAAAEWLRRCVADKRARHGDPGAGHLAALDREGEDAAADSRLAHVSQCRTNSWS